MNQPLVTIYGRSGCHLCETALEQLKGSKETLDFNLEEIMIDNNDELEALYGQLIPVIKIDGKHFSHFRIDLEEFKTFLETHRQHQ